VFSIENTHDEKIIMKYDSFIFSIRRVLKEQVGDLILAEVQLLLVERFLITKGIFPGIRHHNELVRWFDLTIGEKDVDLLAQDKHVELFCALQIKPRISNPILEAPYLTCLFLSLHDNLEIFYRQVVEEQGLGPRDYIF
jgi:hypothetical protein